MYDFLQAYWCFAPYLAILLLLTVMSIREGRASSKDHATADPRSPTDDLVCAPRQACAAWTAIQGRGDRFGPW